MNNPNKFATKHPSLIEKTAVSLLQAPLLQDFHTASGRHRTVQNFILTVTLADGTTGYGEATIPAYAGKDPQGAFARAWRDLQKAGESLHRRDADDYLNISSELRQKFSDQKPLLAAFEMALLDAVTRRQGIPLWRFFGETCTPLTTDITIVLGDVEEAQATARKYYQQGFRAFKIKICRNQDFDFKRILAVKTVAPDIRVYLDANQGYSAKEILDLLNLLEKAHLKIDLLEQPVPRDDWDGLKEVTRSSKVPVCADESVRSLADAAKVIKEKAASVINIKLMKFGLFEAQEIARLATANGIGLMVGQMMESSLATMAAAHFASGLKCFTYVDLDAPFFIPDEVSRNPYLRPGGVYEVQAVKSGIGIIPHIDETPSIGRRFFLPKLRRLFKRICQ